MVRCVKSEFSKIVDANEITGWDGGTVYNYDDREEVKGGEGSLKDYKYKFADQGLMNPQREKDKEKLGLSKEESVVTIRQKINRVNLFKYHIKKCRFIWVGGLL